MEANKGGSTGLGEPLLRYLREQDGASAAEYAIILAAVGGMVAISVFSLATAISNPFNAASGAIKNTEVASAGSSGSTGSPAGNGNGNGNGNSNAGGNGNGNGNAGGNGNGKGKGNCPNC